MTRSTTRPHVAVVGGGVLGLATAARVAARGASVDLVTQGELGDGASGRSLSWLNSFGGARSDAYHQLRLLGIDRYRTLAARSTVDDWLRFDGGLTWPAAGEVDSYRAHFAHMRANGYAAEWLRPEDVAAWTPGVDPAVLPAEGAIYNPGEGWVDLESLVGYLAERFAAAGGRLHRRAGPATVEVVGGRARGVRTAAGAVIEADAVLLATGAALPRMVAEHGVAIPDATPTALLVRTRPVATDLRAVLNTPRVALRPAPGGSLVMDSDRSADEVIAHADGTYEVKDTTVEELLAAAQEILAGHPELEAESYGVGPKPIPGDGDPVLGEVDEVPGLFVAFTHSGATLGLIAGELLADEIVTGERSPLLAPFRPTRFA